MTARTPGSGTTARRVVLIFIDGMGLGEPDPEINPLRDPDLDVLANYRPASWSPPAGGGRPAELPAVERDAPLPHGGRVVATDASLGLPGLPQSATGQATILTGVNAAALIGRHLFGFPNQALRDLIARASILKQAVDAGARATFINAYRPRFFEMGEAVWQRRLSVTTWVNRAAGQPFRTLDDVLAERAVYQDITHDSMPGHGLEIPLRDPEHAGEILARESVNQELTLFEFFQSDRAGHSRDRGKAERELRKLERFVGAVLAGVDLAETVVILCSDHGNIEDLRTKTHTTNPVPTIVFGPVGDTFVDRLRGLEHITPAILELLALT